MNPLFLISGLTFGVFAALLYNRAAQAQAPAESPGVSQSDVLNSFLSAALPDTIAAPLEALTMDWQKELIDGRGKPYAAYFATAETVNSLPPYLLARMAWQECHYRNDIIYGPPNNAGAQGIMQIIPAFHPGVDPSDPVASINYAGKWMSQLFVQFQAWSLALMAYNWGPANVNKFLENGGNIPQETADYYASILDDVNAANGSSYA